MTDETKDPLRAEVERIASEIEEALRGPRGLERGALSAAGVALRTALSAPPPEPQGWAEVEEVACALLFHHADGACVDCGSALNGEDTSHGPICRVGRLFALLRALRASVSGAPALAPWYEADGSTVMLPAAEVERRRKLAAKVIGAARRLAALDTAYREWQKAHPEEIFEPDLAAQGDEADEALLAAVRALDASVSGTRKENDRE